MANQRRPKEKQARPSSDLDKKVDVHLFVVPGSLWRPDLRFVYNTICVESLSCGFVRVLPSITLKSLRDEISQQSDCSLFPSTFVFLRSIGKCLTWVTPKQEATLKLRVFLPPLAPCPEIYILDATYLQLPEGATSLPPLHSTNAAMQYAGLGAIHRHPLHDTYYSSYNGHNIIQHGHGYATPYYHQPHHPSHGSHPHSCTPPNLMPLPPMYNLPESGPNSCHGDQNESYNVGSHPLDQLHKTSMNEPPCNNMASKNHRVKDHHNIEQVQRQYFHHENGLNDYNGSRVHPFNQQVNQSRGSHPANALHHNNGLTDPNDCSGSRIPPFNQQVNPSRGNHPATLHHENDCAGSRVHPFDQHRYHPANNHRDDCGKSYDHELLHEAPIASNQQLRQSTYNSKIGRTSGVKHGRSANRCQETNELNNGYQDHSQYNLNTLHPQQRISLRHQSQGSNPSPKKSKDHNQSDYHYNDSNSRHHTRPECESNDVTYDQLSSKDRRNHFKNQWQDQAIHTTSTGDSNSKIKCGADSGQYPHTDSHYRHGFRNGPCDIEQDNMDPNYHEIKRSHPMGTQSQNADVRERIEDHKYGEEEADVQSQEVYAEENVDQELIEDVHGQENQEVSHNKVQQKQQYDASKQPRETRKATQKSNRTGGEGNSVRKRSATYPLGGGGAGVKHLSIRQTKRENKKKSQTTNSGSHIPIPGTKSSLNATSFSKATANRYDPSTSKSTSRNDEFSRRLPLPPIGSDDDLNKGKYIAKKSSTKLVSKSQSNVKRPSTQQTNEILAQIRSIKDECEELSSNKAELSSVLRTMQHDIRTQREQADKEWKRKYFQEKKFSSTLENRIKKTKDDLQQLQGQIDRKQGNHLKDSLHTTSVSTEAPSELSNMKIRCKKNQASIQGQRIQLEVAKKRLAAERNARKTLENECKDLRRELLEKKIACTRTKRQPVSTQS